MVLAAVLIFLVSTTPVPSQKLPVVNWSDTWIAVGTDANGATWMVRAGDMANGDNYRPAVWVMKDHRHDRSTKARMSRSLQVIDCMAATSDVRATVGFSPAGAVLWSAEAQLADPKPIVPSSMADIVRQNVCPKTAVPTIPKVP